MMQGERCEIWVKIVARSGNGQGDGVLKFSLLFRSVVQSPPQGIGAGGIELPRGPSKPASRRVTGFALAFWAGIWEALAGPDEPIGGQGWARSSVGRASDF